MTSWKKIRTLCTVLLLIPIVHVVYLMSRDTMETLNKSPQAWARDLKTYAEIDGRNQLPGKPIVIVGGRRVTLWPNAEQLLAPRPVLMRGLGDAIVEDITYNYTQLIGFYRPDTVVLLPGNSEFHIRDNKSGAELLAAIQELVNLDSAHDVTRRFYVFAPIKTILRPQDYPRIEESTRLLRAWSASSASVVILDANPLLAGADGQPNGIYFRGDGVNLNEHGYLRLSVLLLTQVEKDTPTMQAAASAP